MRTSLRISAACAVAIAMFAMTAYSNADVTVGVANSAGNSDIPMDMDNDMGGAWRGFMNVYNLNSDPDNITAANYMDGGAVFGSGWGIGDLVAVFDDSNNQLSLFPNQINDPNEFWYQNTTGMAADPMNPGGPGQMGNKIMEANLFIQATNVYGAETLTFEGNIDASTFTNAHLIRAFIKDFAPDFSSVTETFFDITGPGAFSVSALLDGGAGRNVQYGFQVIGQNVWSTDIAPFGSATISTIPEPTSALALGVVGLALAARRRR